MDSIDKLNQRSSKNLKKSNVSKLKTKSSDLAHKFRTGVIGLGIAGAIGAAGVGFLAQDYFLKRQDFPVRNVLYQGLETVSFNPVGKIQDAGLIDRTSEIDIHRGGEGAAKLGELMGTVERQSADDNTTVRIEDPDNRRLAEATEKRERLQSDILQMRGVITYNQLKAELINTNQALYGYTFTPQRGNQDITITRRQDGDHKQFVNELVELRTPGLGTLYGEKFRAGTKLLEYSDTQNNKELLLELSNLIEKFDQDQSNKDGREEYLSRMLDIQEKLDKDPILVSLEDGFIDWMPQESSSYLFSDPKTSNRLKLELEDYLFNQVDLGVTNKANPTANAKAVQPKSLEHAVTEVKPFKTSNSKEDLLRVRVENHWDLAPGHWWPLSLIPLGTDQGFVNPFRHYNNGGYSIHDEKGEIARIELQDFWYHYGDDVLYSYFLDKNGDGKINEDTEMIGKVLYRISRDAKHEVDQTQKDETKRWVYTFMAGSNNETAQEDFYLCNAMETFMVNELNRGDDKHSALTWINLVRSNILFLESPTLENLSRTVLPESPMVAKYDIVAMFRAAGRDYVNNYVQDLPQELGSLEKAKVGMLGALESIVGMIAPNEVTSTHSVSEVTGYTNRVTK